MATMVLWLEGYWGRAYPGSRILLVRERDMERRHPQPQVLCVSIREGLHHQRPQGLRVSAERVGHESGRVTFCARSAARRAWGLIESGLVS